jgi:hypothetical protein
LKDWLYDRNPNAVGPELDIAANDEKNNQQDYEGLDPGTAGLAVGAV